MYIFCDSQIILDQKYMYILNKMLVRIANTEDPDQTIV